MEQGLEKDVETIPISNVAQVISKFNWILNI